MNGLWNFLGDKEEDTVDIVSGGNFNPTGFIGQIMARVLWSFWSMVDIIGMGEPDGLMKRGKQDSWWYYHENRDAAKEAASLAGASFATQTWRWEMQSSSILNVSESFLENWSDVVGNDCRIATRGKHYHETHLISLPYAVQALALAAGYIQERIFHTDEVFGAATCLKCNGSDVRLSPPKYSCAKCGMISGDDLRVTDALFTDEFQAKMIGGDGKSYKESILKHRRDELWSKLGEENLDAYKPADSGSKFDASSEKLSNCLRILTVRWQAPLWGRLLFVPDPRLDAVFGSGRRNTIPVLWEVFESEEKARSIAATETDKDLPASTSNTSNNIVIPNAWKDFSEDWSNTVKERKQVAGGNLPPVPVLAKISSELDCTVDELKATWEAV